MNTIKIKNLVYLLFITMLFSCNKNDNPIDKDAKEGGLTEINTTTVVYFINTMDQAYDINLKYYHGAGANINTIEVYKQFFTVDSVGNTISSDKTLFKSIDLSSKTQPGYYTYTASFNDLAAGTTINGALIPQADTLLKPGFYWILSYNIKLNDGRTVKVNENTIFINSRFAGTYNVVNALYYRLGLLTYDITDWPTTVKVTALNATTFKMEAPCEPFGSNEIYFTIDDASGAIQVLKTYQGDDKFVNSVPIATCSADPGAFNKVPCDGSNIAIKVPTTKDSIKITYGYVTPSGGAPGPREFYQVMVKQ